MNNTILGCIGLLDVYKSAIYGGFVSINIASMLKMVEWTSGYRGEPKGRAYELAASFMLANALLPKKKLYQR